MKQVFHDCYKHSLREARLTNGRQDNTLVPGLMDILLFFILEEHIGNHKQRSVSEPETRVDTQTVRFIKMLVTQIDEVSKLQPIY